MCNDVNMQIDKFLQTKYMKNLLFLFLSFAVLTACSSDDSSSDNSKTKATIALKDVSGNPVSNVVVYAYNETTWGVIGNNTLFADFQAAADGQGIATFENIFSDTSFNSINNYQNTFRFSVRYTLNGNNKIKFIAVTFTKGESKTGTIILN